MNVRMYKASIGRVEDIEVFTDPEDAAQTAAMLERHVYPAVEMLSTGLCSVTLEADDLQEDLVCQIVRSEQNAKVLFQAKSGHVSRATVATLRGDMAREHAEPGVLITLDEPTKPMQHEAASAGIYQHPLFDYQEPRIRIVTVREIIERVRMALPMTQAVVKAAQAANAPVDQLSWL